MAKNYYDILGVEKSASKEDSNNILDILGISFELNAVSGGLN